MNSSSAPVVVHPPGSDGGRRVQVDGEVLGVAYGVADLVEFLRRAGLEDAEGAVAADKGFIEWRGEGPGEWIA
ncbi:hypothetical protein ABZV64_08255 [Streptomyces sp. NPDC004959]|uniref:hypothetical protein n=1 Tax=unclassified Streptomyces TaxID=2593676 RepID=UPI0004C8F945|nr:hypothetical protein [Streptomyces sp. NRRL F-5630]